MSTAIDTPEERLAEYARLFEAALVRRERLDHAVVFVFRATPGTRAKVDDLARREAACCPFMDYQVETVDDEVTFTFTNAVGEPAVDSMLDAVYALPEHEQQSSSQAPW
jgi:hypothetical protein